MKNWVLQIAHSYEPPFLDCSRQYAALFKGSNFAVLTVYLTGKPDDAVVRGSDSDDVVFLGFDSKQVRGLKLSAIRKIRHIATSRDFRFCIAHRVKPTYVALLGTRLPVISVHHAFGDYDRMSRRLFINRFTSRVLMLGVSNAVRDDLRHDLSGWPTEDIQTLYNRIDVAPSKAALMSRSAARSALGLADDAYVIGNVGRLHNDKDQTSLIKGYAAARPYLPQKNLLVIMGKGKLEQKLRQLAADLKLDDTVVFTGQVKDARNYFAAFDCFALTSNREPFGMVLLEAMLAEVPVVCSNCGGGAEVVDAGDQLFEFGDAADLADKLVTMSKQDNRNVTDKQNRRLATLFTDDAARATFWNMPAVKRLV